MPGVKFRVHPLFLLAGLVCVFTGDLMLFLAAVVAAVEHECAHAFAARRYGFTLDTLILMPYGAVIAGDIAGIGKRQELAVLAAGPLANACTALLFAALWWLWPETYAYTDTAAYVSLSLFLVNLLPAYPLDGGRMLHLCLSRFGETFARRVCRAVTFALALLVLGWFVFTCTAGTPAFSALVFSVLLAAGAFGGARYARLPPPREKRLRRGAEERRVVIDGSRPLQSALRFLSDEKYLVLVLYLNGEYAGELSEEEFLSACRAGDYMRPLAECLPKF